MRTVYWMAKEDIPMKKYTSLIEFQKVQQCEALVNLTVAGNASYVSRPSGEDFQACVAEQIQSKIIFDIRNGSMYSNLLFLIHTF